MSSISSTTLIPETALQPARIAENGALTILFVEDNPGDVELVREALLGFSRVKLWIASDGLNALRLLEGNGEKPDLILLDLNMPVMDGRVLLSRIKSNPGLCSIPVIVLTSSKAVQDVRRAYNLHCNCYITKPLDFDGFERAIHRVVEFWADTVQLPDG